MSKDNIYRLVQDTKLKLKGLGFTCGDTFDEIGKTYLDMDAYCGGYVFVMYYDGKVYSRKKTILVIDETYSVDEVIKSIAHLIIMHRKRNSAISGKWMDYINKMILR